MPPIRTRRTAPLNNDWVSPMSSIIEEMTSSRQMYMQVENMQMNSMFNTMSWPVPFESPRWSSSARINTERARQTPTGQSNSNTRRNPTNSTKRQTARGDRGATSSATLSTSSLSAAKSSNKSQSVGTSRTSTATATATQSAPHTMANVVLAPLMVPVQSYTIPTYSYNANNLPYVSINHQMATSSMHPNFQTQNELTARTNQVNTTQRTSATAASMPIFSPTTSIARNRTDLNVAAQPTGFNTGHRNNPVVLQEDDSFTGNTDSSSNNTLNFAPFRSYSTYDHANTPKSTGKTKKTIQQRSEEDVCSICLSDFSGRKHTRTLDCDHKFHKICINKWLFKNSNCPYCRQPTNTRMNY